MGERESERVAGMCRAYWLAGQTRDREGVRLRVSVSVSVSESESERVAVRESKRASECTKSAV